MALLNESNPNDIFLFNTIKYWTLLWLSWASLIGSLLIIAIALVAKPIKSDYRFFIANLFFIDLLSSAVWVVTLILAPTSFCAVSFICVSLVLILFANILGMITALLPAVISRYVLFCRAREVHDRWFTRRKIFFYLFVADVYPIFTIVCLYIVQIKGSKIGITIFTFSFLFMFLITYLLIAYCSFSVYLKIKGHFSNERIRHSRRFSDYSHESMERDVVKATLYQAVVPLIAQSPQFISVVLALFQYHAAPAIDYWGFIVALFMVGGPLVDVLLTFTAIRAYRLTIERLFNRVKILFKPTTDTTVSAF